MLSDKYTKDIYTIQLIITTIGVSIIGLMIITNMWGYKKMSYKLAIQCLKNRVMTLDKDLIFNNVYCLDSHNTINEKRDILELLDFLKHQ